MAQDWDFLENSVTKMTVKKRIVKNKKRLRLTKATPITDNSITPDCQFFIVRKMAAYSLVEQKFRWKITVKNWIIKKGLPSRNLHSLRIN